MCVLTSFPQYTRARAEVAVNWLLSIGNTAACQAVLQQPNLTFYLPALSCHYPPHLFLKCRHTPSRNLTDLLLNLKCLHTPSPCSASTLQQRSGKVSWACYPHRLCLQRRPCNIFTALGQGVRDAVPGPAHHLDPRIIKSRWKLKGVLPVKHARQGRIRDIARRDTLPGRQQPEE
jgi:hypothetical protein